MKKTILLLMVFAILFSCSGTGNKIEGIWYAEYNEGKYYVKSQMTITKIADGYKIVFEQNSNVGYSSNFGNSSAQFVGRLKGNNIHYISELGAERLIEYDPKEKTLTEKDKLVYKKVNEKQL